MSRQVRPSAGKGGKPKVSKFDEFMEYLEAALQDQDQRADFANYVHDLTREQQREILAEAAQRDPEGCSEWNLSLDSTEDGERLDQSSDKVN
ncbi:MAG TPA: hypothetical protein VGB17_11885 [Pyrinomonadaceae bacterium]